MISKICIVLLTTSLNLSIAVATSILHGEVIHGDKDARKLGYPTANIRLENLDIEKGVYACSVEHDGKTYKGMGYTDKRRPDLFEAHMFGFDGNIYGDPITIKILKKIRAPEEFSTFERLLELIQSDAKLCQECGNNK